MNEKYNISWLESLLGEPETYKIEFKGAEFVDKRKPKTDRSASIAKHISAMANAAGGTIIFGIKEVNKVAEAITPINEFDFSKESLQQIIDHNIQPKIDGLNIVRIQLDTENNVVYVVEIPRSFTAHQSLPHRQYFQRRSGSTTEPMVDSEIRDVMNRGQSPKIELEFEFVNQTIKSELTKNFSLSSHFMRISAYNRGYIFANYVNAYFEIPKFILPVPKVNFSEGSIEENLYYEKIYDKYKSVYEDNTTREHIDNNNYGPARFVPILPDRRQIWTYNIREDIEDLELPDLKILWKLFVDNSGKNIGSISLNEIPFVESIIEA